MRRIWFASCLALIFAILSTPGSCYAIKDIFIHVPVESPTYNFFHKGSLLQAGVPQNATAGLPESKIKHVPVVSGLNITEEYNIIGMQYTDTVRDVAQRDIQQFTVCLQAYVATLLSVLIPSGILYLYFAFAGAATHVSGIFAAISLV